ncbi:MAG: hypothetical protein O2960_05905 [Verrucomicrobia bacterium]|nr:hypothetical protein [Verrucomicrobiota bacterium]
MPNPVISSVFPFPYFVVLSPPQRLFHAQSAFSISRLDMNREKAVEPAEYAEHAEGENLRACFEIPERGVVLDQPQRASIFLRISFVLRAAADLRYSRAPSLKQALRQAKDLIRLMTSMIGIAHSHSLRCSGSSAGNRRF